jgi:hypothetical protein
MINAGSRVVEGPITPAPLPSTPRAGGRHRRLRQGCRASVALPGVRPAPPGRDPGLGRVAGALLAVGGRPHEQRRGRRQTRLEKVCPSQCRSSPRAGDRDPDLCVGRMSPMLSPPAHTRCRLKPPAFSSPSLTLLRPQAQGAPSGGQGHQELQTGRSASWGRRLCRHLP